jgi:putative transposase
MRVMFAVTNPVEKVHTMTKREGKAGIIDGKGLLVRDEDFLWPAVERFLHAALEAEDDGGYWSGEARAHGTAVGLSQPLLRARAGDAWGALEPQVPQDRAGRFSTELFERYQRVEKALGVARAERDMQGVSTR